MFDDYREGQEITVLSFELVQEKSSLRSNTKERAPFGGCARLASCLFLTGAS